MSGVIAASVFMSFVSIIKYVADPQDELPASAICGALFLLVIDNIARTLTYADIPIGILTVLVGAPLFSVLFIMNNRYDRSE
ncbi:iron chelate uptake ABC transporter family permease subunit [Escherichia coli]|uniref:iron chelate uptake ABC transporter family permease subunit n=1 Tax=Escherichia coli TaxID=562 RepID=UPI00207697A8|nr:iron chelate uptake ABC transporter family permease subunit [Escherichia coli]